MLPLLLFLSTPSARRATSAKLRRRMTVRISIHALREEGDEIRTGTQSIKPYFYPRPPRGGRRGTCRIRKSRRSISIHALREEGDPAAYRDDGHGHHFYPRPPRGGRLFGVALCNRNINFYPRPPRGGRLFGVALCNRNINFYPRPPRGGRQDDARPAGRKAPFLSTPSARRATNTPAAASTWKMDFYPRPPRGGRRSPRGFWRRRS